MKTRPLLIGATVFFSCLIFAAAIAWLGGYNFDERNPDVAFFAAMTLFCSFGLATTLAVHFSPENKP